MRAAFFGRNTTTFALLALLALTLVAMVAVPTHRVRVHRPPFANGRIARTEPAARAGGIVEVPRGHHVVVHGSLLDDRKQPGRGVFVRVDGAARTLAGRYDGVRGSFTVPITTAELPPGEHHASVWLAVAGGDAEPLFDDVVFVVE